MITRGDRFEKRIWFIPIIAESVLVIQAYLFQKIICSGGISIDKASG